MRRQRCRKRARLGVPVSLVISDLDHFKAVNDTFGHAAGDTVIVTFAGFLRSAMAEHHVAGRIGGEEFAILLPGTNLVAARLFAEGARSAFAALTVDGMPETKRFTASFGVAELARRRDHHRSDGARRQGALPRQEQRPRLREDRPAAGRPQVGRRRGRRDQPGLSPVLRSRTGGRFSLFGIAPPRAVATGVVTSRYFAISSGEK